MHSIKFIRENSRSFDENIKKTGFYPRVDKILCVDNTIRNIKTKVQHLQRNKNKIARQIFDLKRHNKNYNLLQNHGHKIKQAILVLEKQKNEAQNKLNQLLIIIPNAPEEDVPHGQCEDDNKIIKTIGHPRIFHFKPKSHYDLGESLGLMDFKAATQISGSRFVILKKDFVKLERALMSFMINTHVKEFGFEEVLPPALVLERTMIQAGQLPKFEQDSFKVGHDYRLIPTAEIPIVCMHADRIIKESDLPLRYVGYTQCFRSEVGSAGRDVKGIMRQHQFSKIELVSIVKPEKSQNELTRLVDAAELILKKLELPYRISLLCTQDIGFCSQKTYDLEVWLPHEKKYREISSCSNCGTFQAIRMKSKYKSKNGHHYFVHTLNASGLAIGRTIAAIVENYQNLDGSISIPEIIQPFMQDQKLITKSK